jgi:hypothetical protein
MMPVMKPPGWGLGQFKYVMPLIQAPSMIHPNHKMALWNNIGDKKGFEEAVEKASGGDVNNLLNPRWGEIYLEAHNEYLEWAFQAGWAGLALILLSIGYTLWMPGVAIAKYGFLISCLSAIWFFSWQIVPIAIITTLYMGVLHEENNRSNRAVGC